MTDDEKSEIIATVSQSVINQITTNSVSITEVDTVTDTSTISTLPCVTTDGTIVKLAVSTLAAPANAAASNANTAASAANAAASTATTATTNMQESYNTILTNANTTIENCNTATAAAQAAANNIGNKKILVITEDLYLILIEGGSVDVDGETYTINSSTIYFCTE